MEISKYGGPAFPRAQHVRVHGLTTGRTEVSEAQEGMSLLDWFAGEALDGVIDRSGEHDFDSAEGYHAWIADEAYGIAMAMLERRRQIDLFHEIPDVEFVDVTNLGDEVRTIERMEVQSVGLTPEGFGLAGRVVMDEEGAERPDEVPTDNGLEGSEGA